MTNAKSNYSEFWCDWVRLFIRRKTNIKIHCSPGKKKL